MPHPYQDPDLPIAERVDDLLGRLDLEAKAGQVSQYFVLPDEIVAGFADENPDAATTPIEERITSGGTGSVLFVRDVETATRLQRLAVERSPHGIPLLFGFDVIHGFRTAMPVGIGLAATWSPEAAEAAQRVAAAEARSVGIHWAFSPMVDIARDPRWGRMIEGAGEDPFLGAAMAAAQVRGFQGDLGPANLLAGPKHFAGYGAARGGRDYEDAEISDSELYNVYLPPFQAAIDAGAANIMSAYMDLNGVPASANRWLLTDVLRGELGFEGFVVSDANAVRSLVTQHFAADLEDAAVRALDAGLDMEMVMLDAAFRRLPDAVRSGAVDEAALDEAVRRVLTAKMRLGLFERPYADEGLAAQVLGAPEHADVARDAAERSFVLLKNDGVLPLDPAASGTIAVVGQLADSPRDQLGPWIFDYDLGATDTILSGIRARVPDADVRYAEGAGIPERLFESMFDAMDDVVARTDPGRDDDAAIDEAVALAEAADVAIVVVGQRQNQIGEKASVSTLDLPGRQVEQLERIVATGTPTVVLVMSGRPLDLRAVDRAAPAIVEIWYPGTRGGEAVAAMLFGDESPAGRLPVTWPRHVGQVPMILSHYRTFAPQEAGERYWDEESTPLYPFGHGLSYATFDYGDLELERASVAVGETARLSVAVTNTSDRDADEVVQLYLHQRHGTSSRPVAELKGFERVRIAAGATVTVRFALGPAELGYWSAVTRGRVQDAATIDLQVGGTSAGGSRAVLEVTAG